MNIENKRVSERGNVLFLILIAVALFAALSYVVTRSTNSGSNPVEGEKAILSNAQMTDYPNSLRTTLIRMILAGSSIETIKFNAPGSFGTSTNLEVFHPQGGGETYQQAPADLMDGGKGPGTWYYNANFDIPGIGSDGIGGNDVIAFLPGVSANVCRQVNQDVGIVTSNCTMSAQDAAIPEANPAVLKASIENQMDSSYAAFPNTDQVDLQGAGASCVAFTSKPSGCFRDVAGNQFVFYSLLLER